MVRCLSLIGKISKLLKYVTVEPIGFLMMFGLSLYLIASQTAWYTSVCLHNYNWTVCHYLNFFPTAEKFVQNESARWSIYRSWTYLLPAIIADSIMGPLGDKYGRQINMLWGLAGGICFTTYAIVILDTFPKIPLYLLLLSDLLGGCSGCLVIIFTSADAYLVDITSDQSLLTVRLTIYGSMIGIGQMTGQLVSGILTKIASISFVAIVAQFAMVLAFFYTLFFIEQKPPQKKTTPDWNDASQPQDGTTADDNYATSQENQISYLEEIAPDDRECLICPAGDVGQLRPEDETLFNNVATEVLKLLRDCWITIKKPRSGHTRCLWVLSCIVHFFIMMVVRGTQSLFTLYAFGPPLHWKPSQVSFYQAADSTISTICGAASVFVLKKLKFRDSSILVWTGLLYAAQLIIQGLAQNIQMMFMASLTGAMSVAAIPCTKSFVAKLVDKDEVGKAFTIFSITHEISLMVAISLYNGLYPTLRHVFPGFIFVLSGFVVLFCCLIYIVIHVIHVIDEKSFVSTGTDSDNEITA